jgi:hypothetical protein
MAKDEFYVPCVFFSLSVPDGRKTVGKYSEASFDVKKKLVGTFQK